MEIQTRPAFVLRTYCIAQYLYLRPKHNAQYAQHLGREHEDTLNVEASMAELNVATGVGLEEAERTFVRCVVEKRAF